MPKIDVKTPQQIAVMAQGGQKLAKIREALIKAAKPGTTTLQLDSLADKLIKKSGGEASFKLVPGYRHATCINVNDVVVHGIPNAYKLKKGDKVGIDVGLFYKGFHTDTSTSVAVGNYHSKFLQTGTQTLKLAISQAQAGRRVADISSVIQSCLKTAGFSPVRALTGHGIGRHLHEEPAIPCFVVGNPAHSPKLETGMTLAIEIMYNAGKSDVVYKNHDGWTIATADGKISGLFEETVAITPKGPVILTRT